MYAYTKCKTKLSNISAKFFLRMSFFLTFIFFFTKLYNVLTVMNNPPPQHKK